MIVVLFISIRNNDMFYKYFTRVSSHRCTI